VITNAQFDGMVQAESKKLGQMNSEGLFVSLKTYIRSLERSLSLRLKAHSPANTSDTDLVLIVETQYETTYGPANRYEMPYITRTGAFSISDLVARTDVTTHGPFDVQDAIAHVESKLIPNCKYFAQADFDDLDSLRMKGTGIAWSSARLGDLDHDHEVDFTLMAPLEYEQKRLSDMTHLVIKEPMEIARYVWNRRLNEKLEAMVPAIQRVNWSRNPGVKDPLSAAGAMLSALQSLTKANDHFLAQAAEYKLNRTVGQMRQGLVCCCEYTAQATFRFVDCNGDLAEEIRGNANAGDYDREL
jgi:hypothetical protein